MDIKKSREFAKFPQIRLIKKTNQLMEIYKGKHLKEYIKEYINKPKNLQKIIDNILMIQKKKTIMETFNIQTVLVDMLING